VPSEREDAGSVEHRRGAGSILERESACLLLGVVLTRMLRGDDLGSLAAAVAHRREEWTGHRVMRLRRAAEALVTLVVPANASTSGSE
jgi:hypothetical protein